MKTNAIERCCLHSHASRLKKFLRFAGGYQRADAVKRLNAGEHWSGGFVAAQVLQGKLVGEASREQRTLHKNKMNAVTNARRVLQDAPRML